MSAGIRSAASCLFGGARLPALLTCVTLLCPLARADNTLFMALQINGSPSGNQYWAFPQALFQPNDADPQHLHFQTASISSADGQYQETFGAGGSFHESHPTFADLNSWINSLQQSWAIVLDQGLSTQRTYTTTLSVGQLATTDQIPPIITYPPNESILGGLTPVFQFTPSSYQIPMSGSLSHTVVTVNPDGSRTFTGITDDQFSLPPGTHQWSPPTALLPSTTYEFDLEVLNRIPVGFAFSDPVDASSNAIPGWNSFGNLTFDSYASFQTPVPEPAAGLVLAAGAILTRRRFRRLSPGSPNKGFEARSAFVHCAEAVGAERGVPR